MSLQGVLGACSLEKNFKITASKMPFPAFQVTVNGNIAPIAEKPQKKGKEVLKRLVKKRKGKVSKTGIILSQKREVSDQNGRVGISDISQRMTLCMLPQTKTVGADLQSTALLSTDDEDDYQWFLMNLEIILVLEMFADTDQEVIQCWLQLTWGFPPRSKLTLRKVFHPAVVPQPLFRQNLLMLKLMWQFVLNRVWQIVRCMFMSGSNNRETAVLKDVITTGRRSLVTRLVL